MRVRRVPWCPDAGHQDEVCFDLFTGPKVRRLFAHSSWFEALERATGQNRKLHSTYKLIKKIGRGKTGKVWLAQAPNSKQVAVKLESRDMQTIETQLLAGLYHDNIIPVESCFYDQDSMYLVQELGKLTLRQFIEENEYIDQHLAKDVVFQLADALSYLKSKGILHRDIKSENVVITGFSGDIPKVKLVDFGASSVLLSGEKEENSCGTLSFSAPEVLKREPYGFEADIYSLGVVFYELLSKRVPYEGRERSEVIEAMRKAPRFGEEEGFQSLSGDTEALIQKMLHQSPKKRADLAYVQQKLGGKRRKFSGL